jgi:hypothetical protein
LHITQYLRYSSCMNSTSAVRGMMVIIQINLLEVMAGIESWTFGTVGYYANHYTTSSFPHAGELNPCPLIRSPAPVSLIHEFSCSTVRCNSVKIKTGRWSRSWTNCIKLPSSQLISIRSNLILSLRLLSNVSIGHFPRALLTKIKSRAFLVWSTRATSQYHRNPTHSAVLTAAHLSIYIYISSLYNNRIHIPTNKSSSNTVTCAWYSSFGITDHV